MVPVALERTLPQGADEGVPAAWDRPLLLWKDSLLSEEAVEESLSYSPQDLPFLGDTDQ